MLGQLDFLRFAVHCASGEYVPWQKTANHPDMQCRAVQFHCLQFKMGPCGDHGAHAAHHRNRAFLRRQDGLASPELAYVVDYVEQQLRQLEGCINSTFATGTGDVRHSMVRFADLKNQALGDLLPLLSNPGTGEGANRSLDKYPASSWACLWPMTREARGDASALVGYCRQFLSCVCYARGQGWIPLVIAERFAFTGTLILNSALGDLRKLSPELRLPAELPDNLKHDW